MSKYNVLAVNIAGGGDRLESLAEGTNVSLTSVGNNGKSAVDSFRELKPDLVLIETGAEESNGGFDLANELNEINPVPVLFLVDKNENGREDHIHYPVTKKDFSQTVSDAIINFRKKNKARAQINEAPLNRNVENHSFFVKIGNTLKRVETRKIEHIEVQEKYCSVNVEGRQIHVKIALKDFVKKLPESKFIRVHRNFVVNTDFVESVNLSDSSVILKEKNVPFSRTYKEQLMNKLNLI